MHSDLIGRLEAATGPDRALDWAIVEVIGKADFYRRYAKEPLKYKGLVPAYTASIDAALTLLPEHKNLTLNIGPFPTHVARLDWPGGSVTAVAPTPALAICIAALRAGEG